MDNKIKWNLKEIRKGVVRIGVDQLSKIPSIEEYEEHIAELLGIDGGREKLLDETFSPDIAESQLVYHEFNINRVVFSGPNGDISVGKEDFKEIFRGLQSSNRFLNKGIKPENLESIMVAREELFERG